MESNYWFDEIWYQTWNFATFRDIDNVNVYPSSCVYTCIQFSLFFVYMIYMKKQWNRTIGLMKFDIEHVSFNYYLRGIHNVTNMKINHAYGMKINFFQKKKWIKQMATVKMLIIPKLIRTKSSGINSCLIMFTHLFCWIVYMKFIFNVFEKFKVGVWILVSVCLNHSLVAEFKTYNTNLRKKISLTISKFKF